MRRFTAVLAGLMLSTPLSAATITLTDKVAYNVGAPSLAIEGVQFTAEPNGYLQFTGYGLGVCSAAGWSCNEAEFPEALSVQFAQPVTVTALRFGYLQNVTPARATPGYLPYQEIATIVPSSGAPLFFGGLSFDGTLGVSVNLANITGFRFFGIGVQPGVWGDGLHGASLAGFDYTIAPPAPPNDPPPPVNVPEPALMALMALGTAYVLRRRRV